MNADRKAALKRAYKERTVRSGIFKIVDDTSGRTWVDASANVDTVENRIRFTLGVGNHPNKALQARWNAGGPEALRYEVVEVFPADATGYELDRLMKDRKQYWLEALQSEPYR